MSKEKSERYKKTNVILGEGSFKTVTKAIDIEEGKEVAYNEIKLQKIETATDSQTTFSKEIALLKNIDHPNILKIVEYWFEEENFIFITELMTGGTLRDYILKVGTLNINLIRKWGKQILQGLNYLHNLNPPIIHRDIKNENIFVNSSLGEIKIGDLGIAKEKKHKRYTMIGTLNYMAREMFEGDGYSEKVDLYAFGMCLIEMVTGESPYAEYKESNEIKKSVLKGILPYSLQKVKNNCLKSLIINCLVSSSNRYSASQCLDHHFFHPDVKCMGNCIPKKCSIILPILEDSGIELSLLSYNENIITFQIQIGDKDKNLRFIKFSYVTTKDSIERISEELKKEKVLEIERLEIFSKLLKTGLEIANSKKQEIKDGIIIIKEEKINNEMVLNNEEEFIKSAEENFGEKTLEVMQEIESEILMVEKQKEQERKREEEVTKRLRAKLEHKDAQYEILENKESPSPGANGLGKSPSKINVEQPSTGQGSLNSISQPNTSTTSLKNISDLITPQERPGVPDDSILNAKDIYSNFMKNSEDIEKEQIEVPQETLPSTFTGSTTNLRKLNINNPNLIKCFEIAKRKYTEDFDISVFTMDAAVITDRGEDNAKLWYKILIENDLKNTSDLKLLSYEDWNNLNLTVFACRTMQNILFGMGNFPLKERQFPLNSTIENYDNSLAINKFIEKVCETISKEDLASKWQASLNAQDIRTVGELKCLQYDDWERLELPILGFRILKNVIYRRGKIIP